MTDRDVFPFARTCCACRRCSISCEHVPGALAPDDLARLAGYLGYGDDLDRFARENLLASEGVDVHTGRGETVRLRTLVPATHEGGHCKFLHDGRCAIHAVSPFGCAYFDAHQRDAEFAVRADALYRALYEDLREHGPYAQTWDALHEQGRCAAPLPVRTAGLHAAMRAEGLL